MGGVLTGAIIYGSLSDRSLFFLLISLPVVFLMCIEHLDLILCLSIRFGRRLVLIWSYLQIGVLGCSSVLSSSFSVYCIFRFLNGMAVSGVILNGFSLSIYLSAFLFYHLSVLEPVWLLPVYLPSEVEWIPTKTRTVVGTLTSFFFTFGQMILAGLAYWLKDWRMLQLSVSAPHFLFFAYSWCVCRILLVRWLEFLSCDWSFDFVFFAWLGGIQSQLVGWW